VWCGVVGISEGRISLLSSTSSTMELKALRERNNILVANYESLEERYCSLQARVSELEERFKTTEALSSNLAVIEKRVGEVEAKVAAGCEPKSESGKCDDKDALLEDSFKERTLERLTNLENKIHNISARVGVAKSTKNDLTPDQKCLSTKDGQKSAAVITYCQYPPNFSGNISVTNEDYLCLRASQFLNDVMIDFFLKYLQYSNNGTVDQDLMAKTHIFTTFFFKRLTTKPPILKGTKGHSIEENPDISDSEKMYERVKKWTKRVDLFDKDFIVVPINEKAHWYVCIICYPSDALSSTTNDTAEEKGKGTIEKKPCILVFDSLADGDDKEDTCGVLRRYLSMELKNKKLSNVHNGLFTEENMPQYNPRVRGQKNSKDCGIFLLQYVEKFFRAPLRNWTEPEVDHTNWFPKEEALEKRGKIAKLIRDLATRQHYEKKSDQKLDFPPLNFQSVESPVKRQKPTTEVNTENELMTRDDRKQSTNEPREPMERHMVSRGKMVVLHKTSENYVSVKQCKSGGKRNITDTEEDLLNKKLKPSAYK